MAFAYNVDTDLAHYLRVILAKREKRGDLYVVERQALDEHIRFLDSCEQDCFLEATDEENSAAALGYLLALDAQTCGIDYDTYVEMYDAREVSLSHYGSTTTPPVMPGNGLGPAPQTLCLQTDGGSSAG